MIDVLTEKLIELGQARKFLPGRPDRATVWRWALGSGANGVQLESILCGRKRFTSEEAIGRFIVAQNQPDEPTPARNGRKRKADDTPARERLAKAGLLK